MEMKLFKISMLSSLIFLSLYSYGDDYFDPTMLESQLGVDASQIDLSKFTATNSVPPGEYLITVEVNRNILGSK
ncbi:TPA: FimD/PapC N-terminal domain-containing protein, partial [Providencia stuartii]